MGNFFKHLHLGITIGIAFIQEGLGAWVCSFWFAQVFRICICSLSPFFVRSSRGAFSWLEKKTEERGREKGSSDWNTIWGTWGFLFSWFLHVFTSCEVGRPFLMDLFLFLFLSVFSSHKAIKLFSSGSEREVDFICGSGLFPPPLVAFSMLSWVVLSWVLMSFLTCDTTGFHGALF